MLTKLKINKLDSSLILRVVIFCVSNFYFYFLCLVRKNTVLCGWVGNHLVHSEKNKTIEVYFNANEDLTD